MLGVAGCGDMVPAVRLREKECGDSVCVVLAGWRGWQSRGL